MLALAVAKIDDEMAFKCGNSATKKAFSPKKKVGNMRMHAETINNQQTQVKKALEKILTKIPTERHGM